MRQAAMYLFVTAIAAVPGWAQLRNSSFQKHHLSAGLGIAMPRSELQPYFRNAVSWSFGYGYRPIRYLQADLGWDTAFRAADVRDFYNVGGVPVEIRDFQFFIPMGGRVIWPVAGGRLEFYGGGGGAYMRYTERIRQPYDFVRIACPVCNARDGWGYYALLGGSVALTRGQALRLGVTTRVYDGSTDGPAIGAAPPRKTSDRWANTYLSLTLGL
jgi:hypothetical protein